MWPSLRALDQPENGDEDDRADDCGDDRSDRSANGYAARPGSERQWGTVREDYSETGDAWNYFTHDQARSRAYHWGEDGLAGISDDHQRLSTALVRSTAGGGGGFGGPGSTRIAHQHDYNLRRRIHPGGRPERECECREEPFGVP